MDSKFLTNSFNSSSNNESQWYLVQYDKNPQKFIRTIVRSHDIIWNEHVQSPTTQNNDIPQQQQHKQKEHVLIRDQEQIFLGYIIHKTMDEQDALEQQKFLQLICMQLLHSPYEMNDIMEQIHFNHNFWLLVMYSTGVMSTAASLNGEWRSVFGIFHKNDVILKRENQSNNIVAYVQEQDLTHKGIVIKVTNDLSDLMFTFDIIKNDVVKTFKGQSTIDHEKKNQEIHEEINQMEQRMYRESKLLLQAFQAVDKSKTRLRQRLMYLKNLNKLNNIETINNIEE